MRRGKAGITWLVAACLGGAVAMAPDEAEACACCGSIETTYVKAWTPDGKKVLLHHLFEETCNTSEYFSVWTVGEDSADYCLNAYGEDPTEQVDCAAVEGVDPNGGWVPPPAELKVPKGFVEDAPTVALDDLLVWSDEIETDDGYEYELDLRIYAQTGFQPVKVPELESDNEYFFKADEFSVWPAPKGRKAVMLFRWGYDGDTEVVELAWVDLPRTYERSAASAKEVWVDARKKPAPPESWDEGHNRAEAAKLLARARVYERIGNVARAKALAESAVDRDETFMRPWIELARLLTMVGQPHQALAVLSRVDGLKCPACRDTLRTALPNPAFNPIRDTPAFRRLGKKK